MASALIVATRRQSEELFWESSTFLWVVQAVYLPLLSPKGEEKNKHGKNKQNKNWTIINFVQEPSQKSSR